MCQRMCVVFLVGIVLWAASVSFGQPISVQSAGRETVLQAEDGTGPIKTAGRKLRVLATPYGYSVAEGELPGHSIVQKVGYNQDVDDVVETVWPVGGAYSWATQAQQLAVVSASANDTAAGTGIRTVRVRYLNSAGVESVETVTCSGTTRVNLVATDVYRVNNFNAFTAGSTGVAAGNIDLVRQPGTQVYARIGTGYTNSAQAVWTVPAGKTAYIVGWNCSVAANTSGHWGEMRLRATCNFAGELTAGIFQLKSGASLVDNAYSRKFDFPLVLPAGTDIMVTVLGEAGASNLNCMAGIEGWYE
jgi:hypothetical protein